MTSRTPSEIHSETRSPAPYASSSIARSRNASGSSSDGRREQLLDLLDREHLGKRAPALRRLEALARIAHDVAVAEQELEVGADRGDVAPDRRGREPEILQVIDVLAQRARRDVGRRRRALDAGVGDESGDVALVRLAGLADAPCSSARKSSKRST